MKAYNPYTLSKYVRKSQNADLAWWMKDLVIVVLVILLSLLDAITLYTVFDSVMTESQLLGVMLTIGCAVSLNFIPLVAARLIQDYRYKINGVKIWMLWAAGAVFLMLFAATFYLRWCTRGLSFSGLENSMIDTTGQAAVIESMDTNSREAVSITILLGILPFITSAINLALGFLNDDPIRRELRGWTVERQKLYDNMGILKAAENQLTRDWDSYLRTLEEDRYCVATATIQSCSESICAMARFLLAEKLGDADDITEVTELKVP